MWEGFRQGEKNKQTNKKGQQRAAYCVLAALPSTQGQQCLGRAVRGRRGHRGSLPTHAVCCRRAWRARASTDPRGCGEGKSQSWV